MRGREAQRSSTSTSTACSISSSSTAARTSSCGGTSGPVRTQQPLPWAGHTTRYAAADILAAIKAHRLSLIFVNTRSQAELMFQELWRLNDDALPIALHHGSLDAARRRKVEAAMTAGRLGAVVCTSSLDLGIDWGDVDLVINVGAPKGASRLLQRIELIGHELELTWKIP